MKKLTKNQYIEALKSGEFRKVGHVPNLDILKVQLPLKAWTWKSLKDNKPYKVINERSAFIEHNAINPNGENPTRESFGNTDMYEWTIGEVKYLIHAYKNDKGRVYAVSVKATEVV